MFLDEFSIDEKKAFFCLAELVIKSDNHISQEEEVLMKMFIRELGFNSHNLTEEMSFEILIKSTNDIKRKVYIELLIVAYSDCIFNKSECKCLYEIQNKLGLPLHFVNKAKDRVEKYLSCFKEVYKIAEGL